MKHKIKEAQWGKGWINLSILQNNIEKSIGYEGNPNKRIENKNKVKSRKFENRED